MVGGLGCDGNKTVLLQAEVLASVSGLANVQFLSGGSHFFCYCFLSLSSKLSAVSLSFYTCAQRLVAWRSTALQNVEI